MGRGPVIRGMGGWGEGGGLSFITLILIYDEYLVYSILFEY